ncbi:MAG: BPL-N domain-containing protein [Spirochaetia bacterium]
MTEITLNSENPINTELPEELRILYYGGTGLYSYGDGDIHVLANYRQVNNDPAAVNFFYGQGRVVLIGPHPEIEEDSSRDRCTELDGLSDGPEGSDWPWLSAVIDWLLDE